MTKRRDKASPSDVEREAAATRERREKYKEHLDVRLDEALKQTFPASDPIAVTPRRGRDSPPSSR